jgi:ligand-binding sensor domain-containing protein
VFARIHGCCRWLVSLLGVLAFATAPVAEALPWMVRTWQSDVGLPDNTVVGIGQTPDGFLWVATQTGLVRFDGLQFRQFTPAAVAGAPVSLFQAMLVDSRSRLWLAREGGIVVCVDQGRTTLALSAADSLPKRDARMLVEDRDGAVWESYLGGGVVRSDAQCVATDASNGLWIGTQNHGAHLFLRPSPETTISLSVSLTRTNATT